MAGVSSLYVCNLNERIHRKALLTKLEEVFRKYGQIKGIYAGRGLKRRGQAFIAFDSANSALTALEHLQGVKMFQKPMRISSAKHNSDSVATSEEIKNRIARRDIGSQTPVVSDDAAGDGHSTETQDATDFGDPHSRLLLQNIPVGVTLDDLIEAVEQYGGYKEARMFSARHVGFIEFETEIAASDAIDEISRMNIGTVTFAKK